MTRSETLGAPVLWLCAVFGLSAGLAIVCLAQMPDRWVVAAVTGAVTLPLILAARRPRRAVLFVFVFSLQIGLALYLTEPPPASSVGFSWPNSLTVPLSSLTALGALLIGRRVPWVWGGGTVIAAALLVLTTAASIPGSPARFVGFCHLMILAAYSAIFLAAANAVQDPEDLRLVERALLATLVLQSILYFLQSLAGATFTPTGEWIERPEAALGRYGGSVGTHPGAFSSFLLPLLLLAISKLLTVAPNFRLRDGLPPALGCAALVLTFTRAAWIGFALGLLYLLVAGARRHMLVRRNVVVLLLVVLAVTLALLPRILIRTAEDHAAAFEERWALVQMAVRVIQAHPLAGVGAGAYPYVFRDYLTPELSDRWLYVVHNVYLLRAAETGLPGLAAWLVFLWMAFRRASPERMAVPLARRMALGWRAGLIALSWQMLWDVSLGPPANALLWFLCGLMAAAARMHPAAGAEAS